MPRALALLVVLALAGCGESSDEANRYVDEVNGARATLTQKLTSLAGRVTPVSKPNADALALSEYEAAVAKAVTDLEAIEPPGEVKRLHADLVQRTKSYGDAVAAARKVLEGKDAPAIVKAQTDLTTAITATTAEVNAITAKVNETLRK